MNFTVLGVKMEGYGNIITIIDPDLLTIMDPGGQIVMDPT